MQLARQFATRGRRMVAPAIKGEGLRFYLFISPWLIGFILFYAGPIIASFFISFTEWPMLRSPR